jgi:hypothetical protein
MTEGVAITVYLIWSKIFPVTQEFLDKLPKHCKPKLINNYSGIYYNGCLATEVEAVYGILGAFVGKFIHFILTQEL